MKPRVKVKDGRRWTAEVVPLTRHVDEDVVYALQNMLAEAEAGGIAAIALAAVRPSGCVATCYAMGSEAPALIGALHVMTDRVVPTSATATRSTEMDIEAIAREIRARLLDRIEADRCIHASSIEQEVAGVLQRMAWPAPACSLTYSELTEGAGPLFTHTFPAAPGVTCVCDTGSTGG